MCLCVSSTDGAQNISKVQTALEAHCLRLHVIGLTVSHSTHWRRGRLAQWYVYWEALDNRKGGGCCWNVTTIDEKTWTWNLLSRHTHTRTHTPHHNSLWKREKTYSNAQDETVITVSTSSFLHEKFTVTHMREVFFIGTAKAIRCLSQQQNKDEK